MFASNLVIRTLRKETVPNVFIDYTLSVTDLIK